MFHVDFGFCWGADPKTMAFGRIVPPQIKFSKEMVAAMGVTRVCACECA
jgi:phosphatidylinositol kinase/protein kinase (PI-3  family)